jgi:hypothetical protein
VIELLILGNINKRFKNLKQGIEKLGPTITRKAADILQEEVVFQINAVGAVASEDLLKSVQARYDFTSDEYLVEVGSDSPQAYWVEFGRKASGKMPPVDRIYQWLLDKGIGGTYQDAFRVAKWLQYIDTPARFPFQKGFDAALPRIEKYLGTAVEYELNIRSIQ